MKRLLLHIGQSLSKLLVRQVWSGASEEMQALQVIQWKKSLREGRTGVGVGVGMLRVGVGLRLGVGVGVCVEGGGLYSVYACP